MNLKKINYCQICNQYWLVQQQYIDFNEFQKKHYGIEIINKYCYCCMNELKIDENRIKRIIGYIHRELKDGIDKINDKDRKLSSICCHLSSIAEVVKHYTDKLDLLIEGKNPS